MQPPSPIVQSPSVGGVVLQPTRKRRSLKVDATIDLAASDLTIKRDWETLGKLLKFARSNAARPHAGKAHRLLPSLYRRYRGRGFPLANKDGTPIREWRYLTQWMKAQIASLCLLHGECRTFTITIHEELADELRASKVDPKVYLRDRLARCLRERLGEVPWFMFAIENRTRTGASFVKAHVHGMIQILPREPRLTIKGEVRLKTRIAMKSKGVVAVRLDAGAEMTLQAMKVASGNGGDRPVQHNGRMQNRNIWWRKPLFPFSNEEWVSYFFKNAKRGSTILPANRFSMSRELAQEAQRFWKLVRLGEDSMSSWLQP